jgi:hypothetical protein
MAGKKHKKGRDALSVPVVKDSVQAFLDEMFKQVNTDQQYDSFYEKMAADLLALENDCLPAVARRFQKASAAERDVLLNLLKYFTGYQHIQYLQDLIAHEALLPRHGMLMLEIFNRSDVMLESGLASRLMDLDNLTQRIKQFIDGNSGDSQVTTDFLECSALEQQGVIYQLIDESGVGFARFLAAVFAADESAGGWIVQLVTQCQSRESFDILDDLYRRTGRKDIDKIRKKCARMLKQKGINVSIDVVRTPAVSVFKQPELPPERTFISGLDAEGFRLVFMIKPLSQYESKLFNIIIQYAKGIHDIEVATLFRKELNSWIEKLTTDTSMTVIEIESDYGVFLVDEACRISRAQGLIISTNIAQWNKLYAERIGAITRPKIYDIYNDPQCTHDELDEAALSELFERSDCHYWYAVSPDARKRWETISSMSDKQDADVAGYTEDVLKEAIDEFFTPVRRQEFKRRLEEQAYILHTRGNTVAARTALAVAGKIIDDTTLPRDERFCREMVRRGFDFFTDAYRAYRQRSNATDAQNS